MPQIFPMNWFILFVLWNITLLLFVCIMYPPLKIKTSHHKLLKIKSSPMWPW